MTFLQALLISLVCWFISWLDNQTAYSMITQPLVVAPVVGLILGDLTTGVIAGATLQLVFLGVMAIGTAIPVNSNVGTIIGTAFAITLHQGVDVALAIAVPVAALASIWSTCSLVINGLFYPLVYKYIDQGDYKKIELIHYIQAIFISSGGAYILVVFPMLLLGSNVAQKILDMIPAVVVSGIGYMGNLLPAVGIALLLRLMWSKKMAMYYFLGFVLVAFFKVPLLAVACLGLVYVMVLYVEGGAAKPKAAAVTSADKEELFND